MTAADVESANIEDLLYYARGHDLIIDYTSRPEPLTQHEGRLLQSTLPQVGKDGFVHIAGLADVVLPETTLEPERIDIPHEVIPFLRQTVLGPEEENIQVLLRLQRDSHYDSFEPLEQVLLRTDAELDLAEFYRDQHRRAQVEVASHGLPLEPVDVEAGEGLDVPKSALTLSDEICATISKELLDVPKDALRLLQRCVKPSYGQTEAWQSLVHSVASTQPSLAGQPLTPPISPVLAQAEPYIPQGDVCRVPTPAEPLSLIDQDAEAAQARIFETFGDTWRSQASEVKHMMPDESNNFTTDASTILRADSDKSAGQQLSTQKLDLPLICEDDSTTKPHGSAKQELLGLKSQFFTDAAPQSNSCEDRIDSGLAQSCEAANMRIMRAIDQEKLFALDSKARIAIPVVDFDMPGPAWMTLGKNSRLVFKWIQESHAGLFRLPKWPVDNHRDRQMTWMPIRRRPILENDEWIHASDCNAQYLTILPDSSADSISASHPSHAYCSDARDDTDDEIQPLTTRVQVEGNFPEVSKAKRLARAKNTHSTKTVPSSPDLLQAANRDLGNTILVGDCPDAATKLLDNFMQLNTRKPKKRKLTHSSYFPSKDKPCGSMLSPPEDEPQPMLQASRENRQMIVPTLEGGEPRQSTCPPFVVPQGRLAAIISTRLPRGVIKKLQHLLPTLTMLERDYSAHNTVTWTTASTISRQEAVPTVADDADISLTPSIGIILTSMVSVHQRIVSGTGLKPHLRQRIEIASRRYEQLIVLAAMSGKGEADPAISSSDTLALADFYIFTSNLNCDVNTLLIDGGPDNAAQWIAMLVCRYAEQNLRYLEFLHVSETRWELFLRHAGMNALAAQVTIGLLPAINSSEIGLQQEPVSLAHFVGMDMTQMLDLFGPSIGSRVLKRVCQGFSQRPPEDTLRMPADGCCEYVPNT